MSWSAYRLIYQAKSPIHIGWHTLGYIKLTRYYITGKNMWGAITANITRTYGKYQEVDEYTTFGNLLKSDILISYFYPAIYKDKNFQFLLPEYTENGLRYGKYSKEDFERIFISSYGQTAVLPESNTAEDETLHESEYIAPMIEVDSEQQPVYFAGYVFIRDNAKTKDDKTIGWDNKQISLKEAVSEIFVGGDRKYGWGRLLLDPEKTQKVAEPKIFENELILNNSDLKIKIEEGRHIPAHLETNATIKIKGDIEPLVGREWTSKGAGQDISEAQICWTPGSILLEERILRISEFGIFKI